MLIDLHIHTRRGSLCSVLRTKDIVKQAKKMHLDAVCITDHNTMREVARIKKIGKEDGLLILGGIEVRSMDGDILVFGLLEPPPTGIMAQELVEFVHHAGGAAIPAHPFRASTPSLGRKIFEIRPFDALEVFNGNASTEENRMALEAAQKLNLPGTGGSDAHSYHNVGKCVTEFEDDTISNEWELVTALKSRRYQAKQLFGE